MSCCKLARLSRLPAWATYDSTWQGRMRLNAVPSAARYCRKHCAVRRWLETVEVANPRTSRR